MTDAVVQEKIHAPPRLDERKVQKALSGLYPTSPPSDGPSVETMARVVVLLSEMELPDLKPAQISGKRDKLRQAFRRILGEQDAPAARERDACRVERLRGGGLGPRVKVTESRKGLRLHTMARPLEGWAGPVAGAGEIENRLGIPRSTLSNWRARKAAIGLLRGERKLAYPLDQFVDARPVQGLTDVLKFAPDERAAWLWLRQTHPALAGRTPLRVLKSGRRRLVAEVAERDFSIERDFAPP